MAGLPNFLGNHSIDFLSLDVNRKVCNATSTMWGIFRWKMATFFSKQHPTVPDRRGKVRGARNGLSFLTSQIQSQLGNGPAII